MKKNKKAKNLFIHPHKHFISIPIIIILFGIFSLPNTAFFAYITENSIISTTNRERAKQNLNQLIPNEKLQLAAQKKAEDIFLNQSFSHNINNKKFSSWVQEQDYNYTFVGENLAIDFVTNEGVINAWLNSPSHKENLLNTNFEEIGVAVTDGIFNGEETTLVVQVFGKTTTNIQPNFTDNSILTQADESPNIYFVLKNKIKPYNNIINQQNLKITSYAIFSYFIIYLMFLMIYKTKNQKIRISAKAMR